MRKHEEEAMKKATRAQASQQLQGKDRKAKGERVIDHPRS